MDFSSRALEVPEYDAQRVTSSNEACVSVRTIADVDGEVTVFVDDKLPQDKEGIARSVFEGNVRAPSGKIAIVSSENEVLLGQSVADKLAKVWIFVDDEDYPTKVWVVAE